ncbi:uncharacterized protein [Elaeis guineensis]
MGIQPPAKFQTSWETGRSSNGCQYCNKLSMSLAETYKEHQSRGPFLPSSPLGSLTQLRISDLKGGDGKFPPLQIIKNLEVLDISFTNLSDPIPSSNGLRTIS